jgi:hypothetical protein
MIYSDGIHVVATTLKELHEFAQTIGLPRSRYEGRRKGHPHYDLYTNRDFTEILKHNNITIVTSREIVKMFQENKLEK